MQATHLPSLPPGPALPPMPLPPSQAPHPQDLSASHLRLPPTPYQPRPVVAPAAIPQERWYWVDAAQRLAPAAAAIGATAGALALATPMGLALGAAWGAGLALGLPALGLAGHGAWVALRSQGPARDEAWRFARQGASLIVLPGALAAGLGLLGPWGWAVGLIAGAGFLRAQAS